METRSRRAACLLVTDFELLDVAGFAQALSACGRHWNWRPFKLQLGSLQPPALHSGCGLSLGPVVPASELDAPEVVMVGGGYGVRQALHESACLSTLRQLTQNASCVVGVGSGLLLLARAGCLDGRRVATAAALRAELRELAPNATLEDARVLADGTCISGAASAWSLQAGLEVIRVLLGDGLATQTGYALGVHGPVLPLPRYGVTIR